MTIAMLRTTPSDAFEIVILHPQLLDAFESHLLRLDNEGVRLRFGGKVNPAFLRDYAHRVDFRNTLLIGVFVEGHLRGAGELRSFEVTWSSRAEAAFTVEGQFRGRGIGTMLMQALLARATAQGVSELYLAINPMNRPMRRIAERVGGTFESDGEELHARVPVPQL
ncbi:MAG: GNAT family N-acetyltransferase [Hyphomicrobiaceae bacterium]|nr:GNAT family N-acetyltransferase [Hyphomicrobiaceae bacterium]